LTLIQTKKITRVPIVLMGTDYWTGLVDWIKTTVLGKYKNISPDDPDLWLLTDDPEEAVKYIKSYYDDDSTHHLEPNFEL